MGDLLLEGVLGVVDDEHGNGCADYPARSPVLYHHARTEVGLDLIHDEEPAKLETHNLVGKGLTNVVGNEEGDGDGRGRVEDKVRCNIHLENGQVKRKREGQRPRVDPAGPLQVVV